jgi:hypothetical protein
MKKKRPSVSDPSALVGLHFITTHLPHAGRCWLPTAGGYPMKPITKVLERLSKVKQRKPDQWMACCPAHDDRDPSLSIKEAHDGKVLLHCWSGCTADDIVAAIGLELSDLFEESDYTPKAPRAKPRGCRR